MNRPVRIVAGIRVLFGALLSLQPALSLAQQEPPSPVRVEKIEITGSNIRRIEGEGALPVTTITRAEIDRSGATTAAELLEKVTAINAGGFNVSQGVGDGYRQGLSAVSLRGLGSDNTLVLLNGRRLSNFAFNAIGGGTVNLNQIPLAAVERVEVLKDGASAIYGTDAIGGVINFILRKDYEGAQATAYGTSTDGGGGNTRKYTASLGYGEIERTRFNVLAILDYQKDTALAASQRPFASTAIRPDLGFAQASGNVFPANFRFQGRRYNVTAAQGCIPSAGSLRVGQRTGVPNPLQTDCVYDFTSVLEIYPPAERKGFFARATLQLGAGHQAFAEYHLSRNAITFAASETPVTDFNFVGTYRYPAGGPYYPSVVALPDGSVLRPTGDLPINWRLKDAGLRADRVDSDESRLVTGFKGVVSGWDYDAAFSRSASNVTDTYIGGWVRDSLLASAVATGLIDVFSGSPQNAAGQALIDSALILGKVRESDSRVTSFDAKASREILESRHGPVALALGFEHRKEELEERPEEIMFSGDILSFGGALPPTTQASRTITSFFAELSVPLLPNLEAQLAVRHDKFSDFGDSTNPKVALRWTPAKELLVRGSYGTGFRAPTLSDLFLPLAGGFGFGRSDPARCANGVPIGAFVDPLECGETSEYRLRYGGNPKVQPEESSQWTLGFAYEPVPGASLGLDYWSIRRRDTIQLMNEDAIFNTFAVNDPLTAGGRFVRRPRTASGGCAGDGDVPTPSTAPCAIDHVLYLIENMGKYNVTGVDVVATYRHSRPELGTVTLRLDGTYFIQYRYQTEPDGPYADNVGRAGFNGAITRWRHYITVDWRRGPWGAVLAHNYLHGYTDQPRGENAPRRVASLETWDLQGTWEGVKSLSLTLGVRNLFNRDPPASRQNNTFQVGYDARYYDPRGRTWYGSLKYSFK